MRTTASAWTRRARRRGRGGPRAGCNHTYCGHTHRRLGAAEILSGSRRSGRPAGAGAAPARAIHPDAGPAGPRSRPRDPAHPGLATPRQQRARTRGRAERGGVASPHLADAPGPSTPCSLVVGDGGVWCPTYHSFGPVGLPLAPSDRPRARQHPPFPWVPPARRGLCTHTEVSHRSALRSKRKFAGLGRPGGGETGPQPRNNS